MVYFLGRDVTVYIGTETVATDIDIVVSGGSADAVSNVAIEADGTAGCVTFAQSMAAGTDPSSNWTSQKDITGVDVSIGAMDEDITYIGQKGTGKVQVKNEYTISLTKKKSDNTWDIIFNGPTLAGDAADGAGLHGARWGLDGADKVADGLANPKDYNQGGNVEAGYRVFIVMKTGAAGESVAFPNCLLTAHTISMNADGTSEETMEFTTQQRMLTANSGDKLVTGLTATGSY